PGAGRNAISYREDWIETSEKKDVLVLSLEFKKQDYPFEAYHLGGVIKYHNLEQQGKRMVGSNQFYLDERGLEYQTNPDKKKWIFSDFDRVFTLVREKTNSKQVGYDIFGHSAGGQILHRLVLLYPETQAQRIIAANSGFFTLPDTSQVYPFGLKGIPLDSRQWRRAFQKQLIVMAGDKDNGEEKGGTLLRSTSADRQGLHRLARARFFYDFARKMRQEADFAWEYLEVPGVGHEHEKMAQAAAEYLYH
ncbi:MAG: hypothetical protein AAFU64_04450, partial [Bacteroidota bacterium]